MLSTAPNLIEVYDFTAGWLPSGEPSSVPPNGLIDVTNFLLEPVTGAVNARKGFKRIANDLGEGYKIGSIHVYSRTLAQADSLIVVLTNGTPSTANNVILYEVDLSDFSATRISPEDKVFPTASGIHYGFVARGKYYGGGDGEPMYSWEDVEGWKNSVGAPTANTWVDNQNPSAGQVAYDFAFQVGDKVYFSTQYFSATNGWDIKPWHVGTHYDKGDIRTRKSTCGAGTASYRRAYKCVRKHTSNTTNRPGDGTDGTWQKYWRLLHLAAPRDTEAANEITTDWDLIPIASTTSIAAWHGERLWLRWDTLDRSRVQYSAPAKPEKGSELSEFTWDPTDFTIESKKEGGEGGGFIPVGEGDGDAIVGLLPYGYYLLIFKRRKTYVLAGTNRNSWVLRELAPVGCIGPRASCVHDGIVYFLTDEGLFETDGTQAMEVPNGEAIMPWLRATAELPGPWTGQVSDLAMWSYGEFVWMSVPTTSHANDVVVLYHPASKSFWKLGMKVQAMCVTKKDGKDQLFFSRPTDARALVYWYDHPDLAGAGTDDTGADAYAGSAFISVLRSAWFAFGAVREERRVRRTWVLIKGATGLTGTLKAFRNYTNTASYTKNLAPTSSVATFFEGQMTPDAYALSLEVSVTGGPASVLGLAVQTQPRRVRYHD